MNPNGLIDARGTLYGTTAAGGEHQVYGIFITDGCGTVFELTP